MNPLNQFNKATVISLILVLIICLGPVRNVLSIVGQPPDGHYFRQNTAEGKGALALCGDNGIDNTAIGFQALFLDTNGSSNTAVGAFSLTANTAGGNTAVGAEALTKNTTGDFNTATGWQALARNTTASGNTANGAFALVNNMGANNTAIGSDALPANTTGNNNTASGFKALFRNTDGPGNTANGFEALLSNTIAEGNTANGSQALRNNTTGRWNVALGHLAGRDATTGSGNVYIGAGILGVAGESNACYIASIFGQTSVNGIPVLINSDNKLGTATSSKRFKEDIKSMNQASEALFALKPVVFRYKKEIDPAGTSQFGLVAEDVEKANPNLIVRDKEGKPYSVRYDQVNAMLLNEFLKEHRKVQELEANAAKQQKQIAALSAGLQEVSAQVEMGKSVPQTVLKPATRRVGPDLTDQSPIGEVTTKHNRIVP